MPPSAWVFSFFYSATLGLWGTSDFSLLPLVSLYCVSYPEACPFLFPHNFFLLVRLSWKPLAGFPFQGSLCSLILQLFGHFFHFSSFLVALHPCHFPQIVGIFYCWVESSFWLPLFFYGLLIVGSLRHSSCVLLRTFWSHCMSRCMRPACSLSFIPLLNLLQSTLAVLHVRGSRASGSLWGSRDRKSVV